MSYQTRRTGPQQAPQQSAGSVGQRRGMVTNNFGVGQQQQSSGGQQQQRPQQQQQQQQRPPQSAQQQSSQVQFRQQQQTSKPQTPAQQQYNQQQQAQRTAQQQQQRPAQAPKTPQQQPQTPTQSYQTQSFVKAEPATPVRQTQPAPVVPGANPPPPETSNNGESMDTDDKPKRKKPWMRGVKLSNSEKQRRRNLRLSKMLQPKNAVMILNELVKNPVYTVEELDCKVDNNQYKAIVTYEGEDHMGLGRSKILAKNSAAESALKYIIKNKQLKLAKSENQDDPMDGSVEGMEVTTPDGTPVLPWQHVASFALFKLFTSWDVKEDPVAAVRQAQELLSNTASSGAKFEMKPAKEVPANAELMNPIMLLNQMYPGTKFEEVGRNGQTPNVTFTVGVTINDQTFTGTGTNKKTAKKLAAFAACHSLFDIQYSPEVWSPAS